MRVFRRYYIGEKQKLFLLTVCQRKRHDKIALDKMPKWGRVEEENRPKIVRDRLTCERTASDEHRHLGVRAATANEALPKEAGERLVPLPAACVHYTTPPSPIPADQPTQSQLYCQTNIFNPNISFLSSSYIFFVFHLNPNIYSKILQNFLRKSTQSVISDCKHHSFL